MKGLLANFGLPGNKGPTAPPSVKCSRGHFLTEFVSPLAGYSCNVCSIVVNAPAGTKFYGCRICDYDVCEPCYNGKTPVAAKKSGGKAVSVPASDGPNADLLKQINVAIQNPLSIDAHAKAWFSRYDADTSGGLSFIELKQLCTKLNSDLSIPSVDDSTVDQCLKKFDTDGDGVLNFDEFSQFYRRLLYKVRDHYGGFKIRRAYFLEKRSGKPSDKYKIKKTLGQGSFGIAKLVEDATTKKDMVLKVINKEKSRLSPEILEQEFKNMRLLDHPNIIRLFDYFEDYANIYVIMELAEGGDLLDVIKKNYKTGHAVEEKWSMQVFGQVLDAIAYCHSKGVMHKDLKAENIMLVKRDPVHAVVIDFGLAEAFESSSARSSVVSGTPYTMAPEVWEVAVRKGSIGYKCDIYSLGCVMYHVMTGAFPILPRTNDPQSWLLAIKKGTDWSKMSKCSKQVQDLVKQMLSYKEEDRLSARQCLSHAWFKVKPDTIKSGNLLTADQTIALCNYASRNAFQKSILLQVATMARAGDLPQINSIFKSLDSLSDGVIDRDRCAEALVSLGLPSEVAKEVAKGLDADGNNRIEYTELIAGVLTSFDEYIHDLLWGAFTQIDKDGNGYLDAKEIREVLKKGEVSNTGLVPDVDGLIKGMDKDKNGKISFDEFKLSILTKPVTKNN